MRLCQWRVVLRNGRLETQTWAPWLLCAHSVSVRSMHGFLLDLGPQWLQLLRCLVLQGIVAGSTEWPAMSSAPWFGQFCSRVPPASVPSTHSFSRVARQSREPNGQHSPRYSICSCLQQNAFRETSPEQPSLAQLRTEFCLPMTPY